MCMMPKDDISNAETFKTKDFQIKLRKIIHGNIRHDIKYGFIPKNYFDEKTLILDQIQEKVIELLSEKQYGKCAKSGLNMSANNGTSIFSIDRINNELPHYFIDAQDKVDISNCRGILRIFNTARGHFTNDQIAFGLQFNRNELITEHKNDINQVEKLQAISWYNDIQILNIKSSSESVDEKEQNNVKQLNFTTKQDNNDNYENQTFFKNSIMETISDHQFTIDRLLLKFKSNYESSTDALSNISSIEILSEDAPNCTRCKKQTVTDKHKNTKEWKSRCTLCLSKGRITEKNRKRRRTE